MGFFSNLHVDKNFQYKKNTNVVNKNFLFLVLPIVALTLFATSTFAAPSESNLQSRHINGGIGGGFNVIKGGGLGVVGSIADGISGIGSAIHHGWFTFTKFNQL